MRLNNILKQSFYLFIATWLSDRCLEFFIMDAGTQTKMVEMLQEAGVGVSLMLVLAQRPTFMILMVSITWGLYCEICEQKGALYNLSGFWMGVFALWVGLSSIDTLLRYIGFLGQLALYMMKSTPVLNKTISMQLCLMHLGLSLPQWVVMLRTIQALKKKLWNRHQVDQPLLSV